MVLTEQEVEQRKGILRKLREHMLKQRQKFADYLRVLETQGDSIADEDVNKLEAQVKFEQNIVNEIYAFQKVINPLEDMYRMAYPAKMDELDEMKSSLESMKQQVLERSKQNKSLLSAKMEKLKKEILSIKLPFRSKSPYGGGAFAQPSMVDIST